MLTTIIILVYAALFAYYVYQSGQSQWLLSSIALALGSTWLLASVLPGFAYHHATLFLHSLPLCMCLGSLFFFVNRWQYHQATKVFYAEPPCHPYLLYLAITGMTLHLAWLIPMAAVLWQYPEGLSLYLLLSLLQLYGLQPVYWILIQWSMMLVLAALGRLQAKSVHYVTIAQIQMSFLIALLAVVVYVCHDFLNYLR